MNAHDSTVYSARNSGPCAMGMTEMTLSDSPCLVFVLLRHAHVPLEHCTDSSERVLGGCFGYAPDHLDLRLRAGQAPCKR